ncbi:MAG: CPBP family intramembrane metalloprotease [Lachnospiraceae bacterium]|nr:CPBP family intramembrane metalloprotease [Lachnospiraceae bacterium]
MQKLFHKSPVFAGCCFGYGLSIAFLLMERLLLDWSYTEKWVYIDGTLRLLFGLAGLLILKGIRKETFVEQFKKKIDKKVIIYLVPIMIFFMLEITLFAFAENIIFSHINSFFLMWITQITTGLWEETACRGILMSGMLLKWSSTVKGRIACVMISGLLFGSLHFFSFIYGNDMISCLWSALYTSLWGMFMGAIYMVSDNLLLVMFIHAIWDIVVRIPDYFMEGYREGILLNTVYVLQDIIQLAVFPIAAIGICIVSAKFYHESEANAKCCTE